MHKRILSIVLCLAMMMSFAVPAYATDGTTSGDIFIDDNIIMSDGEIITSYDEDGNVVITTQSEETEAPAEETEVPVEETEAPAEETEAPAEETEAPTEETEAPTEETEAPAEETEAEEILTDDDLIVEDEIVTDEAKYDADNPNKYLVVPTGTSTWDLYNGEFTDGINHIYYHEFTGVYDDGSLTYDTWRFVHSDIKAYRYKTYEAGPSELRFNSAKTYTITLHAGTTDKTTLYMDMFTRFWIYNGANVTIQLDSSFADNGIKELVIKSADNTKALFHIINGSLTLKGTANTKIILDYGAGTESTTYPHIWENSSGVTSGSRSLNLQYVTFRNSVQGGIDLHNSRMTSVSLSNCTFESSVSNVSHGGGVRIRKGAAALGTFQASNCSFNTTSDYRGGAVSIECASTSISFTSCFFTNCSSNTHGGAICIGDGDTGSNAGTVTVNNCTFTNCDAGARGGGLRMTCTSDTASVTIQNSRFTDCSGGSNGGTLAFQGKLGSLSVTGSYFTNSTAVFGGAIDLDCPTKSTTITSCEFNNCKSGALQRLYYYDKDGNYVDKDGKPVAEKGATLTDDQIEQAQKRDRHGNKIWNGYGSGGAVLIRHKHNKITISGTSTSRCRFIGCETLNSGGAICFDDSIELLPVAGDDTTGKISMDYLFFDECKSRDAGNAIYFGSCTVPSATLDHTIVEDCTYVKNRPNNLENSLAWPGATMENGSIAKEHNYDYDKMVFQSNDSGGTVRCIGDSRVVLTVLNSQFYRNESFTNGGGIYWNANRKAQKSSETAATDAVIPHLTVTNCTFEENIALRDGGAIYCEASINVYGGNYYRNIASRGGAIAQQVYNNIDRKLVSGEKTELILSETTTMYDNYARLHGGAISIAANATGSIDNGTPLSYPITFQLNGATIRNNVAAENGGGVYFYQPSYPGEDQYNKDNQAEVDAYVKTITIDNGEIHTNISGYGKATKTPAELIAMLESTDDATKVCLANAEGSGNGGGIYLEASKNCNLNISSGSIYSNISHYGNGGGIYMVGDEATLNITGGVIGGSKENYNKATRGYVSSTESWSGGDGGGIAVEGGAIVNMNKGSNGLGGEISYNQSTRHGAGIYCNDSTMTVNFGDIKYNKAGQSGGGVSAYGPGSALTLNGGTVSYNTAGHGGGGVHADYKAVITIDKDTANNTVGKVTHNTAARGGGIFVAYGASLTVRNGHITYNEAKGTPDLTTAKNNINFLNGCGGGILVGDGYCDPNDPNNPEKFDPATFTLDATKDSDVAIYGNLADFAGDDVVSNGIRTKLSIPSTANMNLGDYGLPVMGWFEDYPNEDTSYTLGLMSSPNGVAAYVNGNSDGKFASNENVRYRNVDASKRREAMYQVTNVNEYAPNHPNAYVCLTLGIPAAIDDVVVVDFGLPVDINVIANDAYLQGAKLEAIGLKRPATANAFTEELESAPTWTNKVDGGKFNSKYFSAVRNGDNITFTPMKMDVKDPMEFAYAVSDNFKGDNGVEKTFYFYANVTVIPATNIYFEDSFISFTDATGANSNFGKWTTAGSAQSKDQEMDTPGPNADANRPVLDADNIYGYDDAYNNFTTFSLGSAQKVTVDATTGARDKAPKATFSFTGTGFDVVSLTNNDSGAIWVKVTDTATNTLKKSVIVSNYYGYTYCLCKVVNVYEVDKWVSYVDGKAPDGQAEAAPQYPEKPKHNTKVISYEYRWIADANASDTLYQVPVIKIDDLAYGTYTVEMSVIYMISMDIPAAGKPGGSYTVWIDAVRIYNPRQGDPTSENVYVQDGESNMLYLNISDNIANGLNTFDKVTGGFGFVDGKHYAKEGTDKEAFLSEYPNFGPNNEAYLKHGDGFVFKLRYYSETSPAGGSFHIGAKLATGSYAQLLMTHNGKDIDTTVIKTCTNMFYKCPDLNWATSGTDEKGNYWETSPIYFRSNSTTSSILSLTDLKVSIPYGVSAAEVSEDNLMAIVDTEAAKFAEEILKAEQEANKKSINLAYPTLSLDDEVKYNFYYTINNIDVGVEDMGLITWSAKPEDATFAAAENVIPGAVFNASTGEYMVQTNGIPAKKLGDYLYFRVYAKLSDGTYVYSNLSRYSAKAYAMDRLANSRSADTKALCVALLNYGAAAQMHFGYKTDALVNADLNAEQKALVGAYSADMITALPTVDAAKAGDFVANGGFTTGYPTVSFEGAFAINYYFVPNKTIDGDLTLYCWDLETYNSVDKLTADNATATVVMTQTATGEYFGSYTGIAAKQVDETVFVAGVYESEGVRYSTSVVPYSVGAYCADRVAYGSDTMKVFAAETAVFGHYAEIYFDNLNK